MTSNEAPVGARGTKMEAADAIVAMCYANPEKAVTELARIVSNLYRAGYFIARPEVRTCPIHDDKPMGHEQPSDPYDSFKGGISDASEWAPHNVD